MLKYKIPQIVTLTRIDYIKGYDRYEKSPSNCMFNGLFSYRIISFNIVNTRSSSKKTIDAVN